MAEVLAVSATGDRERLLRVLSAATFVVFFQAYMVAPIIPVFAGFFGTPAETAGFVVPAYLIPYGVATLIYGLLADRLGIQRVMFASFAAFAVLTAATATARSLDEMIVWRAVTGMGASGVVPLALVLVGVLFPYEERGRPLGWLFGAMAGGMAFGSTFGALVEPAVGWRGLFLLVGAAGAVGLVALVPFRQLIASATRPISGTLGNLFRAYGSLLATRRGRRTYGYVLVNSIFHSGVFTWLGVYFERRYGLGPVGVGLALLGYGVPGFLAGPLIGRLADRWGRGRLLPIGLGLGALAAAALMLNAPLISAALTVTALSLGYDMTQPLLAGIVTAIGGQRPGLAMGLNVFTLFAGFGIGSLLFGEALRGARFESVLLIFAIVEAIVALLALSLFASEIPSRAPPITAASRHPK